MSIWAPYVAALRVYEPLETFSDSQRSLWSAIHSFSDKRSNSVQEEKLSALHRLISLKSPAGQQDGVHLLEFDGKFFAAPWTTAMRCWAALNEFKSSIPGPVSKLFLPTELEEELSFEVSESNSRVPHILTQNWMIPPRWFSLYSPEEGLIGTAPEKFFVVYRTRLEFAKKRAIRAQRAVRRAFGPGPVEEELVDLLNWLNVFDTNSIVELDYGGLASILDKCLSSSGEGGISGDTSVEDVQESIEGLLRGDPSMAGSGYERLVNRWKKVSELERAT